MSNKLNTIQFEFKDIQPDDTKDSKYDLIIDFVRKPLEAERIQNIYQQAFIFDLLYRFAQQHLNKTSNNKQDNADQSKFIGFFFP